MANENTDTQQQEQPGFFESAWNAMKDTANKTGQFIADLAPAGAVAMYPFGFESAPVLEKQRQREFSKQQMAFEMERMNQQRQQWKLQNRLAPMAERAAVSKYQDDEFARGHAYFNTYRDDASSLLMKQIEGFGAKGGAIAADYEKIKKSEAFQDSADIQALGTMILSGDPQRRKAAFDIAGRKGIELFDVDGSVFVSVPGMQKSMEITPEIMKHIKETADRNLADQAAATITLRQWNDHVDGYVKNKLAKTLFRYQYTDKEAIEKINSFLAPFSSTERAKFTALMAGKDMLEDGVISPKEMEIYGPEINFLIDNFGYQLASTSDGKTLINGIPAKEFVNGELANNQISLQWNNDILGGLEEGRKAKLADAYQEARAKSGKDPYAAPGAEAEEAGMPNAPLLQAMYGTRYFEADDKTQSKLDAGTAEFTVLAANQRYRDKDGNLKKDLPTLKALDRAWNVRMRSLGIDADEYESPVYTQIQETELLDLEQKLKIVQNSAQGFMKQMKREGHKTNAEKGYVESIGDKVSQANELLLAGLPAAQAAAAQADRQRNARTLREGDLAREIKTLQNEIEKRRKILQAKENR